MRSLKELNFRRNLCMEIIRELSDIKEPDKQEEKESALIEYRRQLASLDKQIEEVTGKPPDIVIGLKSAVIFGKTKGATNE